MFDGKVEGISFIGDVIRSTTFMSIFFFFPDSSNAGSHSRKGW